MIILDTDMPKKCMDCQLLGRDEMYCTLYPRKDLDVITVATSKPDWCPIKCNIEDIKTELKEMADSYNWHYDAPRRDTLQYAILVIDKHIGGRSEDAKDSD